MKAHKTGSPPRRALFLPAASFSALALSFSLSFSLSVSLSGCFDFSNPSELAAYQMLGARATPKAVPAGGRAELDFLAAGPTGIVSGTPGWVVAASMDGPALGSVERQGDQFFYQAPATVAEPTAVTLNLDVIVDGVPLNAIKVIGLGIPDIANPTIGSLTVAGTELDDGGTVNVSGTEIAVTASLVPDAGEMTQLAWYSTFGVADPLRGEETIIEVDPERVAERTDHTLVVVGRDGLGGIAWRIVSVQF